MANKLVFETGTDLAHLASLAAKLTSHLGVDQGFCLWLQAPMGAGKTTIIGHMLRALGLDERIPVTSPTFTYLNEYEINDRWYAHIDLYRAGDDFQVEEIGLVDSRPFHGHFIEWPDDVKTGQWLQPTHILEIAFVEGLASRSYRFLECD